MCTHIHFVYTAFVLYSISLSAYTVKISTQTLVNSHWAGALEGHKTQYPSVQLNVSRALTLPVVLPCREKMVRSSSSEQAPGMSILLPSTRMGASATWSSDNRLCMKYYKYMF